MNDIAALGVEALTSAELEAVSGGMPAPAWWWIFTFALSESKDLIQGIRDGYNG